MFSGIVEEIGRVKQANHYPGIMSLMIEADYCMEGIAIGDSIAINGVCLTVCQLTSDSFTVEVMDETLRVTHLGDLKAGSNVNLERSITPLTRIGGHFVQGHVDGTTSIKNIESDGDARKITFHKPPFYADCLIPKGYIAIDGMSLTLVDVGLDDFSICFIPHTQEVTVVKHYQVGTAVNVEIDHMTKTIVHIMNERLNKEHNSHG